MPYPGLTFRPIVAEDMEFLYRVYASTRMEELAPLNWTSEQLESFLHMQFTAQHTYYQAQFSDTTFDVVMLEEQAIGRLYTEHRENEIRIIDIALLPAYRNQGIGKALLQDILDDAAASGKTVRLHVEKSNPALRLYQCLGFREIGDQDVHYVMEWSPH